MIKILKSIKSQLIIFLLAFALFLSFKERSLSFLLVLSLAIIAAIASESVIRFFKEGALSLTSSSVISGIIVGFVLSSDNPWWKVVLASLLAILSKHLIRIKGRHLFNPAAFGIFSSIILFKATTQWQGTYLWYILIPFGLYFIFKIRKLELLISYFLVACVLFGIQAIVQKNPLMNIFGYLGFFYIMIMIIEPKTSPGNSFGKIFFGAGVALLVFMLTNRGVGFDVELASLLVMNMASPLLSKLR